MVVIISCLILIIVRLTSLQLNVPADQHSPKADIAHALRKSSGLHNCGDDLGQESETASTKLVERIPDHVGFEVAAWLVSPGGLWLEELNCPTGSIGAFKARDLAFIAFATAVLLCVMAARFLTSSWIVGIFAALAIVYRDSASTLAYQLGVDSLVSLLFSLWFAASVHFFRTGSLITLACSVAAIALGSLLDFAMLGLALVLPAMVVLGRPFRRVMASHLIKRMRVEKRRRRSFSPRLDADGLGQRFRDSLATRVGATIKWMIGRGIPENPSLTLGYDLTRGGLFRAVNAPFGLWVYRRRRWQQIIWGGALVFILVLVLCAVTFEAQVARFAGGPHFPFADLVGTSISVQWSALWIFGVTDPVDIYLAISLAIMLVCAFQSPADGIFSFLESVWFTGFGLAILLFFAFTVDMVDYRLVEHFKKLTLDPSLSLVLPPRQVIAWSEPVILTMGISGLHNLIKVADSRLGQT
jgi:hypothetical protein